MKNTEKQQKSTGGVKTGKTQKKKHNAKTETAAKHKRKHKSKRYKTQTKIQTGIKHKLEKHAVLEQDNKH